MIKLKGIHHIAIICNDYDRSKDFYTRVLGFEIVREIFRAERNSYKLDLSLNDQYIIEIFSFPNPPLRPNSPEAVGLRHLAFEVNDIHEAVNALQILGINCETIRVDPHTHRNFTFFSDPDGLPLELYEETFESDFLDD